jgi:hypothetical protein
MWRVVLAFLFAFAAANAGVSVLDLKRLRMRAVLR